MMAGCLADKTLSLVVISTNLNMIVIMEVPASYV